MKIFGIGFHKTGTSSLRRALEILGYSVKGGFGVNNRDISREAWVLAKRLIPRYDAFEDNPWPLLYREIDREYDDCKFILTLRDRVSWIDSVVNDFGTDDTEMRKWIYGCGHPAGNEDLFLERYDRHNREVMDHFRGREGEDFLVLRLTEGEGWEELCPFLNAQSPRGIPFPHRNRAGTGSPK